MDALVRPVIETLPRATCLAVLERNHVGRIAFAEGPRVHIVPVHYVLRDGWIYGRTSEGEKLAALRRNWNVAFEVDEVDDLFEWRSVVVAGGFYVLRPANGPDAGARWHTALDAVRVIVPETLTDADPVPGRTVLFGIAVQDISGRVATSYAGSVEA